MNYYAHISEDGSRTETVQQHLMEVAEMAACFAEAFDASEEAFRVGQCHDAGKYGERFQRKIRKEKMQVDHSTVGAQILFRKRDLLGAMAVAGHHGGLPDLGNRMDTADSTTFCGRMKRNVDDYAAFSKEITLSEAKVPDFAKKNDFTQAFFTRMLFSCLVDADFLCTERFMQNGKVIRGGYASLQELKERFDQYAAREWSNPISLLNEERIRIRKNCEEKAQSEPGFFQLTIPTGGGKTAASMAFALQHAMKYGKSRIIYVIPYTSIIEQNGDVFSKIFGEENVLQHHSNADISEPGEETPADIRKRLAAENWDAPVILTTAVQFFESLFASKTSKCRKLHNIANSIVIFDEAQMLPLQYLRPCLAAIAELVKNYSVSVVMCTATQPALQCVMREFMADYHPIELAPDDLKREIFCRVVYSYLQDTTEEEIKYSLHQENQVLCIVNTRAEAEDWFHSLPGEGNFHLSTRLTPNDRRAILDEVKKRLKAGLPCRLISTSLIEAGVDVDFPVVYREISGIDSIVQAAGRCNREGKRPEIGRVYIFHTDAKPPALQERNISAGQSILTEVLPDDPSAVERYFRKLYHLVGSDGMDRTKDGYSVLNALCEETVDGRMPIRTVSERMKLISEETNAIIIPTEKNQDMLAQLRKGERNRFLMRRLGQDSVNVYRVQYENLAKGGRLEMLDRSLAILQFPDDYSSETGIRVDAVGGDAIFR